MKKLFTLVAMLSLFQHLSFSQDQKKLDSLANELQNFETAKTKHERKTPAMEDTTKANILYEISYTYWYSNHSKALDYAQESLSLSKQIEFKKGIGNAYFSIGIINLYSGNYNEALDYIKKSLAVYEEMNDKLGLGRSYNGLGATYEYRGNYTEALKNYLSSLRLREELGDKNGIAGSFHNIGNIYESMGNLQSALDFYNKAKEMSLKIGNKQFLSNNISSIAHIYSEQGNYPEALVNDMNAMKLFEELGNSDGIAETYGNIGMIHKKQGNYSEALKYYFVSLKIRDEIGDKYNIANMLNNIAAVYRKQNNLNEALKYQAKGLSLSLDIDAKDLIKDAYRNLAVIDSAMNNFRGAYEHHKLYMQFNDSIFNIEKEKKLTSLQMQYDFDRKESSTKAEQEKKDAIALKELQKQKLVRNGFMGGFAIVLLFATVFFTQRNHISKEKRRSDTEKKRSDELLLNILPFEVAEELKQSGQCKAKTYSMVSVMFSDFIGFTGISEKVSAELLVDEINYCFSAFDHILQKHRVEKIKTVGDAYMCASGLPVLNYTHAIDLVTAAIEIRDFMLTRKAEKEAKGEIPFQMRIGIHTGPVVAGIVGVKKFSYDIWGDTVNIASRMESGSEAGKINISGSTYELVKDKFNCIHRGKIQAKHKGEIDMNFVEKHSQA